MSGIVVCLYSDGTIRFKFATQTGIVLGDAELVEESQGAETVAVLRLQLDSTEWYEMDELDVGENMPPESMLPFFYEADAYRLVGGRHEDVLLDVRTGAVLST